MTTDPVKIVRGIICSAGVFAAVAIIGGMSTLNYRFAAKLSDDPIDRVVYGLMAVAVVFVGTIIWLMVEAAWNKSRKTAIALGVAGFVFAGWALTMSAGHIGSNRLTANSSAHFDTDRVKALATNEKALQAELVSLGGYRDAGRIKADLQIMRDSFAWVQTDACKTQKSASQKKFCKAYADRNGELSSAEKAGKIHTELQSVQAKIETLGAHKVGDGQGAVLSGLFQRASFSAGAEEQASTQDAISRWLSLAQAIVSLFAELTIVRILIMLFGWRPEDLVGQNKVAEVVAEALRTNTVVNNYMATAVRQNDGTWGLAKVAQ